ncbi:unnamed protein product [Vitrella brassicaformis CCMP3155]|uniref:Uncharacterized protein n=1 Tax=Vitrella brassicaformis (strain CCMP3155) TaxID=1169540 RepID=A0A0G4EKF2_VITBC|nr:unnamed protein product [Vitrella brassicaformis CCMP3155]|eukprot:CEL97331.1 unnamed protein product [Vitrella brassicaformis CCMP3155]
MSRRIDVPDVNADSREAHVLKFLRMKCEHPAECKAFLESVRGTVEGRDMKMMMLKRKQAAKTSTDDQNQHQQQPAGTTKKVLVRAGEWGEGADGYYASALTQWDLAHWQRRAGVWVVTWTPPEEGCCCVEAGRAGGYQIAGYILYFDRPMTPLDRTAVWPFAHRM